MTCTCHSASVGKYMPLFSSMSVTRKTHTCLNACSFHLPVSYCFVAYTSNLVLAVPIYFTPIGSVPSLSLYRLDSDICKEVFCLLVYIRSKWIMVNASLRVVNASLLSRKAFMSVKDSVALAALSHEVRRPFYPQDPSENALEMRTARPLSWSGPRRACCFVSAELSC